MSAYKFNDPEGIYFVTLTVVVPIAIEKGGCHACGRQVFTREEYISIITDSLKYCQREKGLILQAWVIMTNHMYLIISRSEKADDFSAILRDFKKFTSSQILKSIELSAKESRNNWMLWIFGSAGKKNSNNKKYQFWRQDNHAEQLITNKCVDQKLDYLHVNPVKAGLVDEPESYRYSSARDYAGIKRLLLSVEIIE